MGGGTWSSNVYASNTTRAVADSGTVFEYDKMAKAAGVREPHESLKPTLVAGPASPFAGKVMRESRDSDEHPETTPIVVIFDVTGSMQRLPGVLQAKLPKLYNLLLAKGYVEHPQILFGAVGDAYGDHVPLQVGQFESDNRSDENLANLYLEGGGGGGNHESYELAAYFVANHTATDAWDKRGKRGYCFLVGDERPYKTVNRRHVLEVIGDALQDDESTADVFGTLQERWDTYFLFAEQGSYEPTQVLLASATDATAHGWSELLGQSALLLEDADAICETIALTIGIAEGTITLDEGLEDLADTGSGTKEIGAAGRALATVAAGTGGRAEGDDLDVGDEEGPERL